LEVDNLKSLQKDIQEDEMIQKNDQELKFKDLNPENLCLKDVDDIPKLLLPFSSPNEIYQKNVDPL